MRDRIATLGWSHQRLADEAGVSYNTVNEFLTGRRAWPHPGTRRAIEAALGWSPGSIDRMADLGSDQSGASGSGVSIESSQQPQVTVVMGFPAAVVEGATELELAEARARAEAAYLRTLREHRRTEGPDGD